MKKTIKALAAVMVVLTLCLGLLAGCGSSSPAGTWKCTAAEAMGMSVDPAEFGSDTTMVFNADGTIQNGGTWTLNGNELTFGDPSTGMFLTAQYNGSSFVVDMGIAKITYSRA